MKTISALVAFLSVVHFSHGQLSVRPTGSNNTFLYVNDAVLFVKQDVNLQKNAEGSETEASIYLRKESQLIQGTGGKSTNTGDGVISVFQEGTSNAFDYNYWGAPVSDGVSGNGNFGIQMLFAPVSQTKSLKAGNTSALDGVSSPLTISNRWIHTYTGTAYSDWLWVQDRTAIPAGYGFTMKGVNGIDNTTVDGIKNNSGNSQRYDFRGKANNGPINIPVKAGEMTLIGNPFPSGLDLSLFLLENSGAGSLSTLCYGEIKRKNAITGVAYFWDSVEDGSSHYLLDYIGGYGAFSPVDPCTTGIYERPIFKAFLKQNEGEETIGRHYDRRFSPIAQGFMVEGATDSELTFSNNHRIFKKEGENSTFKSAQEDGKKDALIVIPKVRFEAIINDSYARNLTLAFWPSATSGTDLGMDARSYDLAPTDIGWIQNSQSFSIDVRPFNKSQEIPLFLRVEDPQATLKFRILELENLELESIYIKDTENGIYYPMNGQSFQIFLEKGIYHERFKLCFEDKSKVPPVLDDETPELQILQNNALQQLEIRYRNKNSFSSISLYETSGKKVFSEDNIKTDFFTLSTANLANSVYIVRVLTEENTEISKKITIHNSH